MTAAVPDPRFRDQLAKLRAALIGDLPGVYPWYEIVDPWLAPDGAVGRLIAAEVKARVQAAANQRAAKVLREAADWIWDEVPALASASAELHARADHLDPALASPAPAPHAEEGQR